MKKYLTVFAALMMLISGSAIADIVSFRVGYFIPNAASDLWDIEFENMDFKPADYSGTGFSFSYDYLLSRQISVSFSIDSYTKQKVGSYMGYVGYSDFDGDWAYPDIYEGDFIPSHVFAVSNTPIQVSLKLTPLGRKGRIIPYIGAGVGLYVWSVRMQGDMIDFSDEWVDTDEDVSIYPIYTVEARDESRFSIGFHGLGGIMVPVANRISIEGEFKYNYGKGSFSGSGGFEGFENFDLSGYQITVGLSYWF